MMTGLVFLADSLDITNRHINASASQHIQPDGNLAFAIDIDQFTNQPGQRSFHNTNLLTTCQRRAVHTNSFLGNEPSAHQELPPESSHHASPYNG